QAEDGIRDRNVTGVQTCALPISAFAGVRRAATRELGRGLDSMQDFRRLGGSSRRLRSGRTVMQDHSPAVAGAEIDVGGGYRRAQSGRGAGWGVGEGSGGEVW